MTILSAAAQRKGLEGSNLEVKRGTICNAIRMLETDTEPFALVADISGIDDPITELETLSRACPADVRVARLEYAGQKTDLAIELWTIGRFPVTAVTDRNRQHERAGPTAALAKN